MKILHIIAKLGGLDGGPPKAALELASAQTRLGHEVAVVSSDRNGPRRLTSEERKALTQEYAFQVVLLPSTVGLPWDYIPGLAAFLSTEGRGFDVWHVHSVYRYHTWLAARLAKKNGTLLVIRPHGTLMQGQELRRSTRLKRMYRWLLEDRNLRRCAFIHFTSSREASESTVPASVRSVTVALGTEPAQDPLPDSQRFSQPTVLFLGRVHEKKKLPLLAEATATLQAEGWGSLRLKVAGPVESPKELSRAASFLSGSTNPLEYLGPVFGAQKAELLRRSHVFALLSEEENFGHAAFEALMAGTPIVVTSAVDGVVEACGDTLSSIAVDDLSACVKALRACLQDRTAVMHQVRRQQQAATTKISWETSASQLLQAYEECMQCR